MEATLASLSIIFARHFPIAVAGGDARGMYIADWQHNLDALMRRLSGQ
jgi:hypothetical protein